MCLDELYGAYTQVCEEYGKLQTKTSALEDRLDDMKKAMDCHRDALVVELLHCRVRKAESENVRLRAELERVPTGSTGNAELDAYLKNAFTVGDLSREIKENELYDAFMESVGSARASVINLMHTVYGRPLEKREREAVKTAKSRIGKRAFNRCMQMVGANMVKRNNTCNVFTNVGLRVHETSASAVV
jgi:hypothetical protein